MKVLYIAGEVAPFSATTAAAHLVRLVPDAIQETEPEDFEVRIMMPRYGVVSERRNRLHEVIRLSGAEIHVGEDQDTLKVKVASIPGIRLQVYFMDSLVYFKRKGLHKDRRDGKVFEDNPARAHFFAQAALSTAHKLGWSPDVIHATGWISGLVPTLVKADEETLFVDTKCVYTPDTVDTKIVLSAKEAEAFALPTDLAGKTLQEIGMETADSVAYAEELASGPEGVNLFGEEEEDVVAKAMELYTSLAAQRELAA